MSVILALLGVLFAQGGGVEGEGAHAPQNDVSVFLVRLSPCLRSFLLQMTRRRGRAAKC